MTSCNKRGYAAIAVSLLAITLMMFGNHKPIADGAVVVLAVVGLGLGIFACCE